MSTHEMVKALARRRFVPDRLAISILYWAHMGRLPELKTPSSFNEKLQWLKLNDRNPLYTVLADKLAVKQWVSEIIGGEYVVPTLGVWDGFADIDFSGLPDRFVLKTNHDCGGVVLCDDKSTFDYDEARYMLSKHLKKNFYYSCREWPYKNIHPLIFAEQLLLPKVGEELNDYKIMCFNGEPRCAFVCSDRAAGSLKVDFFDTEWKHLPFERHYPNSCKAIHKPQHWNSMLEYARKLSADIPFVRIDFYEVDNAVRFGEMTFYPGAGWEEFTPEQWDYVLGSWIDLPMEAEG